MRVVGGGDGAHVDLVAHGVKHLAEALEHLRIGYFCCAFFSRSRSMSQMATMLAPLAEMPTSDAPLPPAPPMPATLIFLTPPSWPISRLGRKMPPAVAAVLRRKVRRLGKSEGFMVCGLGGEDSGGAVKCATGMSPSKKKYRDGTKCVAGHFVLGELACWPLEPLHGLRQIRF
jgi:hypothetical protein